MKRAMIFAACIFILLSGINRADAQVLPDLIVAKTECAPSQGKLSITIANRSSVPLSKGWKAVADVYFNGTKKGRIDLGKPNSGSMQPAGGTADYLTVFDVVKPVTVKLAGDPTNNMQESDEVNNTGTEKLQPCKNAGEPDLKNENQYKVINTPFGKIKRPYIKEEDQNSENSELKSVNTPFGKIKRSE